MSLTISKQQKLLIIDPEGQASKVSNPTRFVIKVSIKQFPDKQNVFLILPMEALTKYVSRIGAAHLQKLRVIFVVGKEGSSIQRFDALLDQVVQSNAEKLLPKLFVTGKFQDVDRILQTWSDGVQDSTVAEAWIDGDSLVLKTCALNRLEIKFDQLPWLAKIPKDDRASFEIEPFGRHIVWHKQDVHLNVDAVRCAVDDDFRKKRDVELVTKNKAYGEAIALFREQNGLTQQEVMRKTGITDRQLRRVEREGHSLSVQMVERLAEGHGLSANEYLNAIAKILLTFRTANS